MTRSPDLAISSTQISLESTVPWLNGWPMPSVRTTTSTRYLPPGFERRDLGTERAQELAFDHAALAQAEDVDADFLVAQEPGVPLGGFLIAEDGGQAGVGAEKRWSWISRPPLPSKSLAPKSVEGFSSMWHSLQFDLATSRVVEAPGPVARDAREQEGVVVVLAADEVFVVVDADGQADLVAGRAELGVLDDRLEERLLVHLGLGLDQRVVDPLQERVVAEGEGIMLRALRSCRRRCRGCC